MSEGLTKSKNTEETLKQPANISNESRIRAGFPSTEWSEDCVCRNKNYDNSIENIHNSVNGKVNKKFADNVLTNRDLCIIMQVQTKKK